MTIFRATEAMSSVALEFPKNTGENRLVMNTFTVYNICYMSTKYYSTTGQGAYSVHIHVGVQQCAILTIQIIGLLSHVALWLVDPDNYIRLITRAL